MDDDDEKIKPGKITNIKSVDYNEMAAAVANMRRDMNIWIDYVSLLAEIRKKNYDALLKQGFDENQALILCQNIGC